LASLIPITSHNSQISSINRTITIYVTSYGVGGGEEVVAYGGKQYNKYKRD